MSSDVYEIMPIEQKEEKVEIEYYRPSFWKRIFLILFDSLICFFLCFALFNGIKAIVNNFTDIKDKTEQLNNLRLESGLFINDNGKIIDVVTYYENSTDLSYGTKEVFLQEHINDFFQFLLENCGENVYLEGKNYYDEYRLSNSMIFENKPYFIKVEGEIKKNFDAVIPSKKYVENLYNPFIDEYCQGLLTTRFPEYLSLQKDLSNVLIFVEIPISVFLGVTIVYYVIPLCLRRGRLTLGRLLFKTGLVDKNVLNVNWKIFTLRFLIMFFMEIVLSVFTLCIPLIISLSIMAFSKRKQTFHDYMLGIEEVDTSNSKIYFSLSEIRKNEGKFGYNDFESR